MKHQLAVNSAERFFLHPLTDAELEQAVALCDAHVGKNLYSREELAETIGSDQRFFYFLKTAQGETAGYIYYYLTELERIAHYAKLDAALLQAVCPAEAGLVGKLQSIGVEEEYRGRRMAAHMTSLMLREMKARGIQAVFSVCWKMGGLVPLKKTLQECGFQFLTTAYRVWYDDAELLCPFCKGRCRCDAEVFYKLIDKGDS